MDIAVLGHGVVGSGVLEVLLSQKNSITLRAKEEINVKYILDLRDFDDLSYSDKFVKDFNVILNDEDVKIVVEVMGGLNPAFEFAKLCLENGKDVVSSNKELVAEKGATLISIAQKHNRSFLFEASVGGGIPIIRPLTQCLAANEVSEIAGILNGTTNFILTKMIREHMDFKDALALAQELGYAERNPEADVMGHDACRKICILASLAFGHHVYPKHVYTEGITNISLADVSYADAWGGVIKLIGSVKMNENGKIDIKVTPLFISRDSQLANVDDVFNGILVRGHATGDVVFYGKGAGKLPTASAVVADVIDCVKHYGSQKYLYWEDEVENFVEDFKDKNTDMYIRLINKGEEKQLYAEKRFNTVSYLTRKNAPENEIAIVVQDMTENEIDEELSQLSERGYEVASKVRISNY